ncbi:MAG TPA: hypothetical protein DCY88_12450 [Cyanobacteria bacterium UBA11372]|nr:hypothetical protein [Cyanobacteria bacterium UBA11372]
MAFGSLPLCFKDSRKNYPENTQIPSRSNFEPECLLGKQLLTDNDKDQVRAARAEFAPVDR